MSAYRRFGLAAFVIVAVSLLFVVIVGGTARASVADEPQRHVVGESEIQARIDQQIDQADADRQAIQIMLQRAEIREIAGSAGLDLERASAAAAVLSGSSLEKMAAQARAVNAGLVGGEGRIVLTTTAIIIILLILILLLN
jgi:hypothetical protein